MSFSHKAFGFYGRIGRLTFLQFSILNALVGGVLITIGLVVVTRPGIGQMFGLVLLVVTAVGMVWANVALTVKRLHDVGLAGLHAIWIILLTVAAGVMAARAPILSIVLGVAWLGVVCFLLFKRGEEGRNLFGPSPETMSPPA